MKTNTIIINASGGRHLHLTVHRYFQNVHQMWLLYTPILVIKYYVNISLPKRECIEKTTNLLYISQWGIKKTSVCRYTLILSPAALLLYSLYLENFWSIVFCSNTSLHFESSTGKNLCLHTMDFKNLRWSSVIDSIIFM